MACVGIWRIDWEIRMIPRFEEKLINVLNNMSFEEIKVMREHAIENQAHTLEAACDKVLKTKATIIKKPQ